MRDLSFVSAADVQTGFKHRWSKSLCKIVIAFFLIACSYAAVSAQSTNQNHKTTPTGPTKAQLNGALLAAIKQRNADRVDDLLIRGASPNTLDAAGTPAALLACSASEQAKLGLAPEDVERRIISDLLENGEDVNSRDSHGRTLLIAASGTSIGDMRLLNLILSYKPHIDQGQDESRNNCTYVGLRKLRTWRRFGSCSNVGRTLTLKRKTDLLRSPSALCHANHCLRTLQSLPAADRTRCLSF